MMYAGNMSGAEASGYNSGVFLHRLDRMRAQPAYRTLLPRMAALLRLSQRVRHGAFEVLMMHRLADSGDQTALAVAASAERALWSGLMVPLPCEWNWQVDIFWFAVAQYNVPRRPLFKLRALRINKYDSTCHEAPRLLFFNGGQTWTRAHSSLELGTRGPAAFAYNAAVLRKILKGQRAFCLAAAATLPSIVERACNASFLLQRHSAFVDALWAVAREQELLV
eukprot:7383434-Prymnesium_polylepis.2